MLINLAVAIFSNGHKLIVLFPAVDLIREEMLVGKSTVTQIKAVNDCKGSSSVIEAGLWLITGALNQLSHKQLGR